MSFDVMYGVRFDPNPGSKLQQRYDSISEALTVLLLYPCDDSVSFLSILVEEMKVDTSKYEKAFLIKTAETNVIETPLTSDMTLKQVRDMWLLQLWVNSTPKIGTITYIHKKKKPDVIISDKMMTILRTYPDYNPSTTELYRVDDVLKEMVEVLTPDGMILYEIYPDPNDTVIKETKQIATYMSLRMMRALLGIRKEKNSNETQLTSSFLSKFK